MIKSNSFQGNDHYFVAIGASAGGLEAIHEFFDNMPSNGNLSFIIIQHLSPDYKSLLVELIAKHTHMQVLEAGHQMEVQKNCVYVIPNNKVLTIKGGKLQLSEKVYDKAPNTAIDTFFKSLAKDQGTKAIAVILSGTGTDGSRGIETINQQGGFVLVQDPLTAKFDGMPNTAIATGYADFILSPELMPEEIFDYINEQPERIPINGKPNELLLPEVLQLVEKNCGHDFQNYKSPTILRRIGRRMSQLGQKKFDDYLELLKGDLEECKILGQEFLIGVTKFFRDTAAFEIIQKEILPDLIKEKNNNDVLKIWVTACSTGEEAYSLAILANEAVRLSGKIIDIKIFATDVDLSAIEQASKAVYPATVLNDIENEIAQRYFIKQDNNTVAILPRVRKQLVFARHNIIKDPPFIKNDLVSCRNMLIYMNSVLQSKVLSTLHFSLNKKGILFLGPSEIPASLKNDIEEINNKWKIYRKISNESSYSPERFSTTQTMKSPQEFKGATIVKDVSVNDLLHDFKDVLTEEYGFAAIYIDKNFEVKEAVGDFKKFLSLPDKVISLNVLKMVSTDLSVALNTAIRKSIKENKKIALKNVRTKNKEARMINLFVQPAAKKEGYMMIVFSESHDFPALKSIQDYTPLTNPESISYITELEEDLKETRHELQLAIETLETTNEELHSSNEELQSSNEELQSSNEELQSLNEELHTLNTEHQLRIKELVELNDDLNNYFRSTEIGQLFVDSNLRIRKFNFAAVSMINLIESDIGRPVEHISTNIKDQNLVPNIEEVIKSKTVLEKEVTLSNGSICIMRILPFIRQDKKTDGVVITFIDVTEIKQLDNIIKGVFNSSLSTIMAFKAVRNARKKVTDFKWIAANYAADHFLNKKHSEYIQKNVLENFPDLMSEGLFEKCVEVVETGKPLHIQRFYFQNDEKIYFELVANKMEDGLVLTLMDVNEKRQAEEKFKHNYEELIKVKENYKNLNIALEEKIEERTKKLSVSEERFRLIANATSDAIWDWNLATNEIWWSDSFYTLFGIDKDKEITIDFWMKNIHPDDKKRIENTLDEAIKSGSQNWSSQYRFKKSDGSYAKIFDKGSVITDDEGKAYRMIGAMMDVTEAEATEQKLKQKNSELHLLIEEFKFVTDFMPQMVWSTKADGYHDFYNKQWYDFTGLSYEETSNEGWSLILHPDDFERTLNVWKNSLETGEVYEIEYRMRRNDGEYRWFLARALPLKNEDGKIIKWFGTCTDIHDQKTISDVLERKVQERTQELQKTNSELEASNIELLQFASVASHDLKEPLRKIHMFSNLIKERYLSNSENGALDYMNRIINSSARMTKLINDLLTFSRLSITSFFEITDLNLVIDEVLSDLELYIKEKNAKIVVDDLPQVEIIPGQIRQVFQNLINNSLKFTRQDIDPEIKVSFSYVNECAFDAEADEEGKFCLLKISDNGIGFNANYKNKIFTIFQRLHSREQYDGTGIGLAITKKIIENHNGIITAESVEGSGSTFIIVLPVEQLERAQLV